MGIVDPRYFDFGARLQQGIEQGRAQKMAEEDRAMALQDRDISIKRAQAADAAKSTQTQYDQEIKNAETLFNASQSLKRIPFERRRQTLDVWAKSSPLLASVVQKLPPDVDLSDSGLDEFGAGMKSLVSKFAAPQQNSDFLRAMEILRNPAATDQERAAAEVSLGLKSRAGADTITPYQQAQLDMERQKLGAKTEADTAKIDAGRGQKVRDAVGIARAKQMYSGIDAARGTLANLDELESAINEGANFGPLASKTPSISGASQRGDRALANLALSNIKQLPGPASDKDVAFIRQASISDQMDEKTMKSLIPKLREAAQRVIEKNAAVASMIEQGLSPAEAESQVWGEQAPATTAPSEKKRLKYNPTTGELE